MARTMVEAAHRVKGLPLRRRRATPAGKVDEALWKSWISNRSRVAGSNET
jgi:hypothetical protein